MLFVAGKRLFQTINEHKRDPRARLFRPAHRDDRACLVGSKAASRHRDTSPDYRDEQ
jgi:hypothetical protein